MRRTGTNRMERVEVHRSIVLIPGIMLVLRITAKTARECFRPTRFVQPSPSRVFAFELTAFLQQFLEAFEPDFVECPSLNGFPNRATRFGLVGAIGELAGT